MNATYRFGRFELNPTTRQLLADGKAVAVGARALDVLLALIERREQPVTKNELLDLAWPGLVVEENNLQVQISSLRKLLGPQSITTIPGRGYRFTCSLDSYAASLPDKTTASDSAGALSILVLPFANQTGDPQKAYVADAVTTSITSDLSRIRDVFIIPSTTAFTYKDKTASVLQIGKDEGVRFVLQGSVLSSGDRLRIGAQLADTQSGAQLWTQTFDGELGDLFALQDQVTTLIGNSIGREMVIVAAREAETRKSSPKVADLMLRARALTVKAVQSLKDFREVEALCREVLALEPNHSGAMVDLAISLTLQAANFGYEMDPDTREKKYVESRDFAAKAKEFDPNNPRIYIAIALYAAVHDDYAGVRRAVETRVSLDPKNPGAYNNLGSALLEGGEAQRAIEVLTQAISLDPKHPFAVIFANMSWAYFMLGDNDAAIEWALKSSEINPASPRPYAVLAMAYTLKGDHVKSRAAVADLCRVSPNYKFLQNNTPQPSNPAAYKEFFEKKLIPAWRKAGLPE